MAFNISKSIDVKLNVQPVTLSIYHNYVFEGPCRFEKGDKLKKEHDLKVNALKHDDFVKQVNSAISTSDINILEPIHFQYDESFIVTDDDLAEVGKNDTEVDLYLFRGAVTDLLVQFPQKYRKPMIVMGTCLNTATSAALLARGYEIHPCVDFEEVAKVLSLLRVRKALAETKVLALTRMNSNNAPGMLDSFISLNLVTEKLGTRFTYFNIHEFFDQTHNVPADSNPTTPGKIELNINDDDEVEINRMLDGFMEEALECDMKRDEIYPSIKANYLIGKILERTGCNAFTAPCFDVCATRRFNEERFTFCLNHSLNNENCIPSSCEYDISALLSMVILSNIAKAPAYMGNTIVDPIANGLMERFSESADTPVEHSQKTMLKQLEGLDNLVMTWHSVPNRKMKGFDSDPAPYSIRSFAHSGWGATIRYDFKRDKGQTVTMCRFDPTCSRLFISRGIVIGGIGYSNVNCSEGIIFQVNDSNDFFHKVSIVGNHNPLVYGDYVDDLVKLASILGLETLVA